MPLSRLTIAPPDQGNDFLVRHPLALEAPADRLCVACHAHVLRKPLEVRLMLALLHDLHMPIATLCAAQQPSHFVGISPHQIDQQMRVGQPFRSNRLVFARTHACGSISRIRAIPKQQQTKPIFFRSAALNTFHAHYRLCSWVAGPGCRTPCMSVRF